MTEVCTQCENMASDIVVVGGAVLKGTDGECVAEIMNAGPWCSRSLAHEGADLQNAKLGDARFGTGVDWSKYPGGMAPLDARKQAVNMLGVSFEGAQLERVDLSGVENLTENQLSKTCGKPSKQPAYMKDLVQLCPEKNGG